jgi:selenocysteine lyase/cysteine desulfurase
MAVSRRDFARVFALGGSMGLLADPAYAKEVDLAAARGPLPPAPDGPGEAYWRQVREQFVMPPELAVMNAANLCPSSRPVLDVLRAATDDIDRDPSPMNREKLGPAKEAVRRTVAAFLHVTPEEIVLTRNTSEANNLVSNGLELKAGDEVVIFADNHPSNHKAWTEKAKRFGYSVTIVGVITPHPGPEGYVEAFARAITPRTKLVAFTHLTNTAGDLFPAAEICRQARARGVLTLVDGAQSFGLLDVDLSAMQPDFYTGSAHKWPCGPKEAGVLYINQRAQDRIWPSIYSAYPGAVGVSKTFEGFGQRDEPALMALEEALEFQARIGRAAIERRARALAGALVEGFSRIAGVTVWTARAADRSAAVVTIQPGTVDPHRMATALYAEDRVACAVRAGEDRGGLRFSPHIYNTMAEVDRAVAGVARLMKQGA